MAGREFSDFALSGERQFVGRVSGRLVSGGLVHSIPYQTPDDQTPLLALRLPLTWLASQNYKRAMKPRIKLGFSDLWRSFDPNDNYFLRLIRQRFDVVLTDKPDFLI